ncbi:MAG: PCP reductase family protein [Bacillota bacterium]
MNVNFEGNSKKMYDVVLENIPMLMRGLAKKQIEAWVEKKNISTLTEDHVYQALKDIAPQSLADKVVPQLDALKSK